MHREDRNKLRRHRVRLLWLWILLVCIGVVAGVVIYRNLNSGPRESTTSSRVESVHSKQTVSRGRDKANSASKSANSDSPYSYSVAVNQNLYFGNAGGVNAPNLVAVTRLTATNFAVQMNYGLDGPTQEYHAKLTNVSTKRIRVFSAGSNRIRQVKVNTQLTLDGALEPPATNDVFYLFYNDRGTISVATPNYAGNVRDKEETHVMNEYTQLSSAQNYVATYLTGKTFQLVTVMYNGQDVNAARVAGVIPESFMRENTFTGQFTTGNKVTAKDMVHADELEMTCTVDDTSIKIYNHGQLWHALPYALRNGRVEINNWSDQSPDGATVNWKCTLGTVGDNK